MDKSLKPLSPNGFRLIRISISRRTSTTHLNQFDAHTVRRSDIAQHHARFEFPRLDRHAHAFLFQLRAEREEIASIGEAEVVGAPFVVAGVVRERAHRRGCRRFFAGTLAANHDGLTANTQIKLRRATQAFLHRRDFSTEHFFVPIDSSLRIAADQVDVVEVEGGVHVNCWGRF